MLKAVIKGGDWKGVGRFQKQKVGRETLVLGNFVDKALRLTARKYGSKESPLDGGKLILTLKLQAEADRALETLVLFKHDEKRLSYSVRSRSTHVRAEVSRSVAEQHERDLEAVLEDR